MRFPRHTCRAEALKEFDFLLQPVREELTWIREQNANPFGLA